MFVVDRCVLFVVGRAVALVLVICIFCVVFVLRFMLGVCVLRFSLCDVCCLLVLWLVLIVDRHLLCVCGCCLLYNMFRCCGCRVFVVVCLLFVACCLLCVVRCWLLFVGVCVACLLFVVVCRDFGCCLFCVVLLFVVCWLLFGEVSLLFASWLLFICVGCSLSGVLCSLFLVWWWWPMMCLLFVA